MNWERCERGISNGVSSLCSLCAELGRSIWQSCEGEVSDAVSPLCSVCAECGPQSWKRQQGRAPPQTCMATRNEFLCRNARATHFGNLDLAPSACTLASPLLPNSPLKAA